VRARRDHHALDRAAGPQRLQHSVATVQQVAGRPAAPAGNAAILEIAALRPSTERRTPARRAAIVLTTEAWRTAGIVAVPARRRSAVVVAPLEPAATVAVLATLKSTRAVAIARPGRPETGARSTGARSTPRHQGAGRARAKLTGSALARRAVFATLVEIVATLEAATPGAGRGRAIRTAAPGHVPDRPRAATRPAPVPVEARGIVAVVSATSGPTAPPAARATVVVGRIDDDLDAVGVAGVEALPVVVAVAAPAGRRPAGLAAERLAATRFATGRLTAGFAAAFALQRPEAGRSLRQTAPSGRSSTTTPRSRRRSRTSSARSHCFASRSR
jgi:hypothetical protein